MKYDTDNIFAKILRGEIPCKKIYESDHALAFKDINPQAKIHILVIPKGPYVNMDDFSQNAKNEEIIDFIRALGEVSKLAGVSEYAQGKGYRYISNNGPDGGQEVPHLHFHMVGGESLGRMLSKNKYGQKVQRYFLEMKNKENLIPSVCGIYNLTIQERGKEDPQFCKFLYHKIGEDFHWKDRLAWSISDWDNYLKNEKLKFYIAYVGDDVAGYYEYLHHDDIQEVEITYFGIFKNYFGKKLGAYLLTHALETGWKHNPKRVWVHTCTLDHPNALRNYIARGMNIYKKELVLVPA